MNDVIDIDDNLVRKLSLVMGGVNISGANNRQPQGPRSNKTNTTSVFTGTSNLRRRNQLNDKSEIIHHLQINTLHKFCTVCGCLNLDPLSPHSLVLIAVLLSRHRDRIRIAQAFVESLPDTFEILVDWEAAEDLSFLQDKFSTVSDWSMLLSYTDIIIGDEDREKVCADPYISRFCDSLQSAGLGETHPTSTEFAMRCIMHMAPANTPSSKMLERFLTSIAECRDIEMRCLRAVTSYTDQSNDDDRSAATFLCVLQHVVTTDSFVDDVKYVLTSQKEIKCQEDSENTHVRRPRLRDIVQAIHNDTTLEYQQTFESWCAHKKFSSTTGLNVQRLLYFINAQTITVDLSVYNEYFTQALTSRVSLQHISTIDVDVIIHTILSLRVYQKNIEHLIDFRTRCLEGLSVGTRKALSLAQVLQLYVCCFQHESIRDRCWKAVLPVLNHSIQVACAKFRETFRYEVHAIIRSIMTCHVLALAPMNAL